MNPWVTRVDATFVVGGEFGTGTIEIKARCVQPGGFAKTFGKLIEATREADMGAGQEFNASGID